MNPPKLLLVEDAPEIRLLVGRGLMQAGYQVIEACNGLEALKLWPIHRPDLVLMDVCMPEMDGFTASARLRELDPEGDCPIMMLTGSDDLASIERAFELGATDFITKPINLCLLKQRVRYALRGAERERELRHARSLQESARQLAGLCYWEYDPYAQQVNWLNAPTFLEAYIAKPPVHLAGVIEWVVPEERARFEAIIVDSLKTGQAFDLEVRCESQGRPCVLKMMGQKHKLTRRLIGAIQDLTPLRSLESQADYLSHHDVLTGLPNRKLFLVGLEASLEQRAAQQQLWVLVIQIQRLHQISDVLGVAATDQLLMLFAQQLQKCAGPFGQVARLEGSSFALCCTTAHLSEEAAKQQLKEQLKPLLRQWSLAEQDLILSLKVGASCAPDQGSQAYDLLRFAQRALRAQEASSQMTLAIYQPGEIDQLAQRLSLESELRRAVEQEAFTLAYQPQLNLEQGRVVGVESLLRWQHPEKGWISPTVFIPLLEELGLIHHLGEWVMQHACWQLSQWQQQGVCSADQPLRMGINLSPMQFAQPDLAEQLVRAVSQHQIQPRQIKLEITESVAMQDPQASIALLHQLRELGFQIAIDDFGIGFSSLEYLLRFPLDSLKIDRAFVKDITRGRRDRAIIKSLTSLCQGLNIATIAEGVENQRQRDYVDALGVTEIQGYLLSQPLSADDFVAWWSAFQA
ncbi:EAL domain-containing protein [Marinospirillum sp. MEB164]|uniref:EAL domain-containing protein n=1 Tax=Marinospirillum alkalitolerans TaxID=3123374 RepID=A0ABW8PY54_9GAMM